MTVIKVGQSAVQLPVDFEAATHGGGFAFGLNKAGSTMLNDALRRMTANTSTGYFDFVGVFSRARIALKRQEFSEETIQAIESYLARPGVVWGGWRKYPFNYRLPLGPATRTYLLVRDPRDVVTSKYFSVKYSHSTAGPVDGILKTREMLGNQDIDTFALDRAHQTAGWFRDYDILCSSHFLLRRYEDIIFDKGKFVAELCSHFEIDIPKQRLESVAKAIDIRPEAEDVMAHVRRVTPGDHREKLKEETVEQLNDIFKDILAKYDYKADVRSN